MSELIGPSRDPESWGGNGGDYVTNEYFIDDIPEYPNASRIEHVWKQRGGVNGGYPYITLLPDETFLPINIKAYNQQSYICIYANKTPKEEFLGNGIAILTPSSCEVTEEYNGMWSVNMVHPYDPENRWQLLKISNIIKVMGQLFTIKRVDENWNGKTGSISVYAEHIFYQQNDGWIYPRLDGTRIKLVGTSAQLAITRINDLTSYERREGSHIYGFDGASDLGDFFPMWVKYIDSGCTPVEALMGTDSIIEQKGGELYRNNFYFSINKRMENAQDDAFDIRIGKNLTGIERNIDMTSMISYFRGYDDYGGWFAVAWDYQAFFGDIFPHYVVRSQNFPFPDEADSPDWSYIKWFSETLIEQCMSYFRKNGKPIIGFEINLEDVRKNPDFQIIAGESLRVGDKGRVYDERLGGTLNIEITETVYDAITGKCKRIAIGDRQCFVSTSMPNILFDITPVPVGMQPSPSSGLVPVTDATTEFCFDVDGEQIFESV